MTTDKTSRRSFLKGLTASMLAVSAVRDMVEAAQKAAKALGQVAGASNPLINPPDLPYGVPALDQIKPEHFEPAINLFLKQTTTKIDAIKNNPEAPSFKNTISALYEAGEDFERVYNIGSALYNASSEEDVHKMFSQLGEKAGIYSTIINTDPVLFKRVEYVHAHQNEMGLSQDEKALLDKTYNVMRREGAQLSPVERDRLAALNTEMNEHREAFQQNINAASKNFELVFDDKTQLDGLSDKRKQDMKQAAQEKGLTGKFIANLGCAYSIYWNCKNRQTREVAQKAIDSMCFGTTYDNTKLQQKILTLRDEQAQLLGFACFADYAMAGMEISSATQAETFLKEHAKNQIAHEKDLRTELLSFAKEQDGIDQIKTWDRGYYAERYLEKKYEKENKELNNYAVEFEQAVDVLHHYAEQMLGLKITEAKKKYPVNHPDVRTYEIKDAKSDKIIGIYYADNYDRDGKKGESTGYYRFSGKFKGKQQIPLANVSLSVPPPKTGEKNYIPLDVVKHIAHELGHVLNKLLMNSAFTELSSKDARDDYCEFFSQTMEHAVDNPVLLRSLMRHKRTGEPLPERLVRTVQDMSKFDDSDHTIASLHQSLVDLALHGNDPAKRQDIAKLECNIAQEVDYLADSAPHASSKSAHLFSPNTGNAGVYFRYVSTKCMALTLLESVNPQTQYTSSIVGKMRALYGSVLPSEPGRLIKELTHPSMAEAPNAKRGLLSKFGLRI